MSADEADLLSSPQWLDPSPAGRKAATSDIVVEPALATSAEEPMDPDIAIQVRNLTVVFESLADRKKTPGFSLSNLFRSREIRHVEALTDISLELRTGDALGLVGHNGAGKSTLMHAIAGFIPPSAGEVRVRSQPQMLGVKATLNGKLSGRTNIELGLLALGVSPEELPAVAAEIATITKIGSFVDLPVKTYSSGMRLRLGFAISTVQAPDILIIDEALAVGDKEFKKQSLARLNKIRDNAGVVILASHSLREIKRTCNRVLWLEQGKVVQFGPTKEVLAAYEDTTLGTPDRS